MLKNEMKFTNIENKGWIIAGYALLYTSLFFTAFGVVTVLIPNTYFARMTPVTFLDYIFLTLTSILLGLYLSFNRYQKKHTTKKSSTAAYTGGIFGFLSFGCVLCNKILLLLLGVAGVLTYIEPYRPLLGTLGIGLMTYATYAKAKDI